MSDILDDSGVVSTPVSLDDLVTTSPLPSSPPPVAATRNVAAVTSLVANPFQAQDSYNTILSEANQGQNTTQQLLKQQAQASAKATDQQSLMGLLADPKTPLAVKQNAVSNFHLNPQTIDTGTILQTNLMQKPSGGETFDSEAARISTADTLNEMADSRAQIQVMMNQLKDKADATDAATTFFDAASNLIPFKSAITENKIYNDLAQQTGVPREWWKNFTTYVRPGTAARDLQGYVSTLPPQQQLAVAKAMYGAVQNHSGFLYGNDNQHEAFDQFNKIFNAESYGMGHEFLDNLGGIADLAFAGSTIKDIGLAGKNIGAMMKGSGGPLNFEEAQQFARANANTPSNVRIEPTFGGDKPYVGVDNVVPQPGQGTGTAADMGTKLNPGVPQVPNPQIQQLQDEKASLLGTAGNQAQKGGPSLDDAIAQAQAQQLPDVGARTKELQDQGMKYGDANAQAQKEYDNAAADQSSTLSNLQSQKAAQVAGGNANRRISEIDQQLADIQKNAPTVPAKPLGNAVIRESIGDMMTRLSKQSTTHDINPASPMEIAQNANPDSARGFMDAINKGTDEVAQALTGVDKQQATVNAVMPQVSDSGTVFSRVNDIDRTARLADAPDPSLVNLLDATSVNSLTPAEQAAARARIVNDFGNATGLTANDAMSSFKWAGNRAIINQVYEVPAGSFANAQAAIDQAKFALKHYGITDNDITVLAKQGINHVPVKPEDIPHLPEGDYKIQVSANPEFHSTFLNDIEGWTKLDVKRNWLDRFTGTHFGDRSSLQRYILDASSNLSKYITRPAVIAKDYGARFEKQISAKAEDFAKDFRSFSEARQAKINDYLREANFKGIDFDQADLAARGFNSSEISAVSKWRDFWDTHHYLENLDVVRSLRNQGYEYFKNPNVELFARPMGKVRNVTRFYDPATDSVRGFNAGELDDLYNNGGRIMALRRPASLSGETVEHIISRQTPTEYSRALSDGDRVLNKRKGYYSITYNGAKFIDEVDQAGNKLRTVAVAGDTKEAQSFIDRMVANDPSKMYNMRSDSRNFRFDSDEHWDINSAGGRINQRQRGQLLEDASSPNMLGDTKYIDSPAKSAERAAKSISGRTVMRPMIDTAVQRFMNQYGELLPKNAWGEPRFPQSAKEIGSLYDTNTKFAADARTTWEYLNWLKNGYINSLNDGMKAVFYQVADVAGAKGLSTTEHALRSIGESDPLGKMRKTVFTAYLATSPLHQIMMQGAQAWRAFTYNPTGLLSFRVPKLMNEFYGNHSLGNAATDFTKFMDRSGLVEAVKHHNLLASNLMSLVDESGPIMHGINTVTGITRRIGFDSGELAQMVAHSAAVYDRYKQLGRDVLDRTVQEQMHGEIRALTYDMNAAGDMPYNQGAAAAMLQFMQMPHKAMLQFTNRSLDPATRAKMAIGDLLLWGVSLDKVSNMFGFDFMPDDGSNGSELLRDGAVSMLYNHALNFMFPGSHKADFSGMSPYGLDGWMKFWHALMGQGLYQAVLNSPAAGLTGSRIIDVAKNMASFFAPKPYDSRTTPEKFVDTVTSLADLSSGWSAGHKAYLMTKANEQRDAYGGLIDDKTTTGDTIAQLFGFSSQAQAQNYDLKNQMQQDLNSHKRQVLQVYKDIKKFYAQHYYENDSPDTTFMTNVTGAAMQYYQNDPAALTIIQRQWKLDVEGNDGVLARKMFQSFNLPGMTDYRTRIANGPWDDNTKKQMNEALDYAKNAQTQLDQYTKGNK